VERCLIPTDIMLKGLFRKLPDCDDLSSELTENSSRLRLLTARRSFECLSSGTDGLRHRIEKGSAAVAPGLADSVLHTTVAIWGKLDVVQKSCFCGE
jgi:hypothetical protein